MAWSIFQQGGGQGAAATWAQDLIHALGVPDTPANRQFVYDWEVSEGGGGKYNPLNQGPVPGDPSLTTTGQQYGGGASDFASWQAGIQGAVDYINMPAYSGVLNAMKQSNYQGAASALWQSSWAASHYGNGANWSQSPFPGSATALSADGGSVNGVTTDASIQQTGFSLSNPLSFLDPLNYFQSAGINLVDILERGALIVFGAILIIIGVIRFTAAGQRITKDAKQPGNQMASQATGNESMIGEAEEATGEAAETAAEGAAVVAPEAAMVAV